MNREYFIKLTFAIYQTSEQWPEKNLLKLKARNLANEILTDFILFSQENPGDKSLQSKILKEVEELQKTLFHARAEKFLGRNDFLLFRQEYNNIRGGLERLDFFRLPEAPKNVNPEKLSLGKKLPERRLNERQKKILNVLKSKKEAQVHDLQGVFPQVTKRTLRRDLDGLLKLSLVKRKGEWNKVFYVLVGDLA